MFYQLKRSIRILWPLIALAIVGVVLYCERTGIQPDVTGQTVENAEVERTEAVVQKTDTLLLATKSEDADIYLSEAKFVLESMKVPFDIRYIENLQSGESTDSFLQDYDKLVLCFSNLDLLQDNINTVTKWVKEGGCMMNMTTFDITPNFQVISGKLGIQEGGDDYVGISGFYVDSDFMLGAKDRKFYYDETYQCCLNVLIKEECKTLIYTVDDDLPVLWECQYGEGKFIVNNQSMTEKAGRGIFAAAYSLMDEISVYPVINASAFYLDDFPSPVPSGNGQYIQNDYGMNISNFYANIWWKDMLEWEERYGIVHTGLIIEDYSDIVKDPFIRQEMVERYRFYGNMLLNHGGELGFHGYNHMPLCMENFDYKGLYDSYSLWESEEEMQRALMELRDFSTALFPDTSFQVYVPPSNILSKEGRKILTDTLPEIKAIASTYLPGDCVYEQEFGIGEDGVIETPRITSGAIMDDFTYMITFSELNFHYVQSHFIHPDDVLDEDRGAALGWQAMYDNFEAYLSYVYTAVPDIDDVTGSGMADKVKDYTLLTINRVETENGLSFDLGGFGEEASLMVRVNADRAFSVTGGVCEKLTKNLYLIRAKQPHVEIIWN